VRVHVHLCVSVCVCVCACVRAWSCTCTCVYISIYTCSVCIVYTLCVYTTCVHVKIYKSTYVCVCKHPKKNKKFKKLKNKGGARTAKGYGMKFLKRLMSTDC
jgi:hypothetical protein